MDNRVKELREKAGLKQADLADRIGVTWQTISRIENAHTRIMPKHEKGLARELKVTPGDLYAVVPPVHQKTNPAPVSSDFGSALRQARRQLGFTIRQVADAATAAAGDVDLWESGTASPTEGQVEAIALLLRIDRTALVRGEIQPIEEAELGDATFISDLMPLPSGPRDVEKLGVVAAGDDGDFEFNGQVAEYVTRPAGLVGRPGVFALEVISVSMYPAWRKHDIAFCDRAEPMIGDDVVIETFPEGDATIGKAYIKRLKRRTSKELVVEQFNPPKEISFERFALKHVWRVVPNRELHGY